MTIADRRRGCGEALVARDGLVMVGPERFASRFCVRLSGGAARTEGRIDRAGLCGAARRARMLRVRAFGRCVVVADAQKLPLAKRAIGSSVVCVGAGMPRDAVEARMICTPPFASARCAC